MDSEANGTRYEHAEPHGDVQAERRPLGNAGAEYLGHQDVHQATSESLPQEIEEFEMDCDHSWTTYSVNSNHYSTFNFTGKRICYNHYKNVLKERRCMLFLRGPGYP